MRMKIKKRGGMEGGGGGYSIQTVLKKIEIFFSSKLGDTGVLNLDS